MGFPLTPRSMTLDDLELLSGQILSEFRVISLFWEPVVVYEFLLLNNNNGDRILHRLSAIGLHALQTDRRQKTDGRNTVAYAQPLVR